MKRSKILRKKLSATTDFIYLPTFTTFLNVPIIKKRQKKRMYTLHWFEKIYKSSAVYRLLKFMVKTHTNPGR